MLQNNKKDTPEKGNIETFTNVDVWMCECWMWHRFFTNKRDWLSGRGREGGAHQSVEHDLLKVLPYDFPSATVICFLTSAVLLLHSEQNPLE